MTENAEHIGGKSIAIMQPYLFPYLGYFQLAHSVDEFWLLDTVSFIQHGWMNRNNLMIANTKKLFTIPVSAGPADQVISEKTFARNSVHALNKLQRSVAQSYARAPHVASALDLINSLRVDIEAAPEAADFTRATQNVMERIFEMIGLSTPIHRVSCLTLGEEVTGQSRIIEICRAVAAKRYVNMIGGKDLYDSRTFSENGIDLKFLEAVMAPYEQGRGGEFTPGMSVLDAVAWLGPKATSALLKVYRIV